MSGKNDTGEIIKEFLELWQKQFSFMTKDPEMVASMLKMFAQTQESYFNNLKKENDVKPGSTTDISGNADDEIRELRARIAGLEARVAQLESGTYGAGQKTPAESPRQEPAGTGKRAAKATAK